MGQNTGKSETPCTERNPRAFHAEESPRKFTADGAVHSSISALRSNDEAITTAIGIDAASRFCDTILLLSHTHHIEFYQISTIIRGRNSWRFQTISYISIVNHYTDCFILHTYAWIDSFDERNRLCI